MSRFCKLSHTIWHCEYHIVWVLKNRYRILTGRVLEEVSRCIRAFSEHQQGEVVELNVRLEVGKVNKSGAARVVQPQLFPHPSSQ